VILILVVKFIWIEFINKKNKEIHITKEIINAEYEKVWNNFSAVEKYPKLFPNWVDEAEKIGENKFKIKSQHGEINEVKRELDKKNGIINLKINPEISRTRLISLAEDKTLAVHIGERWEGCSSIVWFFYKRTVDADFKNGKELIEKIT
jgi:hypothetical protein